MFWTAFVWGLGVTLGGSIGLMMFVILYAGWKWLTQTESAKQLREYYQEANVALERRNELSEKMIDHLAVIASAAQRYKNQI